MKLRCVAIDDEPLALVLIRDYVSKFPELELVQTFDDGVSGAEFLRNAQIDLLFIDINMPDITGLDLVKSLKEKPMIIFTTAYKKFAFEGFELDALDYLLKPIDFNRFSKAISKAFEYYSYKTNPENFVEENLFVYSEYRLVKIPVADIEYIESLDDYIKIHFTNAKPILTLMTLKKVLDKLPGDKFKRIHRSYIVALSKIKSVLNRKIQLASMKELPVSDSYAAVIDEWKKK
ncbi:MAG: response regulator transcription factor [Bacteroidetes bacterium]|nr:response regulator transcription factor [Bacteroidota bacterium]